MNTNLSQLQTIEVPLRKLVASTDNVRRTPTDDEATKQLAASIQAVGLLQSLVVQKAPRGKYAVIAGDRRFSALTLLCTEGQISRTHKVPCRLLPGDADLTEISLAENIERESMGILDECAAFQRLVANGRSVSDIAARFGYTEALIDRRLALARLSPVLLDKYRTGEATLDVLQAFTLTSDHATQEQVWNQLPEWNRRPDSIRRLLSAKDIPASDPQVRFVTLSAYEAAGGATKRDLFADEQGNGVFVTDTDLLTRLVNERLEQTATKIEAEGWRWVEIQPETDYATLAKYRRIPGEPLPLPRKQEAQRKALQKELDALTEHLDGNEDQSEECERQYERIQQIEDEIEAIDATRGYSYPEHIRQTCGVIVSIAPAGHVQCHYGLLNKEDQAALAGSEADREEENAQASAAAGEGTDEPQPSGYSAALVESLTTEKTAAIAAELTRQPHIALAAVVYTLLLRAFDVELEAYGSQSAVQVSAQHIHLREAENSSAGKALAERRQNLLALLPHGAQLWPWCLQQTQETLLDFLAYCAASAVNGIQTKADKNNSPRLAHANALAVALRIEMTRWFIPTADNFFSRVSKTQIASALAAAGKPTTASMLALKKTQLAGVAETEIAGTDWLPEPIRITAQTTEPTE